MPDLDELVADSRENIAGFEGLCHRCRAGFVDECVTVFNVDAICSRAEVSFEVYGRALAIVAAAEFGAKRPKRVAPAKGEPAAPKVRVRGVYDSGYVHPDAWMITKNIGDLIDPDSTGHKVVKEMYPLPPGMMCEWANLEHCGGGPVPIIGCMGNPVTDWHHGPDKNTLDNEKVSLGIGDAENVHLICSSCHNRWHALNNPFYPPYDRVADQTRPWLPVSDDEWGGHAPRPAQFEVLIEEERRRRKSEQARGRKRRGRGGVAVVDTGVEVGE